jgi:ElaB/YqjD/DUF883 family membrane-anchored ribosome-binding protein
MRKTGNGEHANLDKFLEDLKTIVHDGQELLKVGAGEAKRRAVLGAQVTERQVREHPYKSIGIVFGLGIVIGLLASAVAGGSSHRHAEEEEA